jgi:hypothetical protein
MKQILWMLQPSPLEENLVPRLRAWRGLQKRLQACYRGERKSG